MRIVLDTNVIISGLFWDGIPGKIVKRSLSGKYVLCFSEETLIELQKVLSYPKFEPRIQKLVFTIEDFLFKLTERAIVVSPKIQLNIIKQHPADNKFIACAIASGASFIVTGDKHLLSLKEFQKIRIITPKEFLKIGK